MRLPQCHRRRIHRTHPMQHTSRRHRLHRYRNCTPLNQCNPKLPPHHKHRRRPYPLGSCRRNPRPNRDRFLHNRSHLLEGPCNRTHKSHPDHCKFRKSPMYPRNRLHRHKYHPHRHPLHKIRRIHPKRHQIHMNRHLPLPPHCSCTLFHPYNPLRQANCLLYCALHPIHCRNCPKRHAIGYSNRKSSDPDFHPRHPQQ